MRNRTFFVVPFSATAYSFASQTCISFQIIPGKNSKKFNKVSESCKTSFVDVNTVTAGAEYNSDTLMFSHILFQNQF